MNHTTQSEVASSSKTTPRSEFWAGIRATIPLVVGAIPFGIIFGALAVTNGLSAAAALGMSAFVFAGASQFIAANMVAGQAAIPFIVLTTFVVNLRHALYAATLAPHVRHLSHRWLVPLGFWLTDETFVVVANRYMAADDSPHKHWFHLGSAVIMYTNWQLCTLVGVLTAQSIENPARWGLDFAMIVTFIGMLVPMIKTRPVLVAVVAAGLAAILGNGLDNRLGL
ncbi:MAG: AzlC family ABC transporter permease, partial [Anaerolineae bacterium]|nr:AzlC family ABC transporter permease [Anaerolineae bacterium]